jgi:hypothetical protein
MARKLTKRGLYPNGWPKNLRAVLYLNQKKRKAQGAFPSVSGQLTASTPITPSTEMSDYG